MGNTKQGSTGPGNTTDRRVLHLAKALIDPEKRSKLILVSKALEKTTTGLDRKPVKLGSMMRFGINGYTFSEIGELI